MVSKRHSAGILVDPKKLVNLGELIENGELIEIFFRLNIGKNAISTHFETPPGRRGNLNGLLNCQFWKTTGQCAFLPSLDHI